MIIKFLKLKYGGRFSILLLAIILSTFVQAASAQELEKPKKKAVKKSISTTMPSGYTQVGNTDLCYKVSSSSIDFVGLYKGSYYGSTYSNGGYKVAMQVDNNSSSNMDCQNGTTNNGVNFSAEVVPQGDLGRVCYYVTNSNTEDVTVSLGIHADVMIGSNDRAPIRKKIDTIGNTYGLAMLNNVTETSPAQLCVLFGSGLPGVTGVSDFWFGQYSLNSGTYAMVGNYTSGNNYMVENGSYDSGMGWCWKNRTIPAGATVTFSWLIGVGEVNLEPNSNFEVTPEDPEGWNDLSRIHVLAMQGDYESPAGLMGKIQYAVEDSDEWIDLTDMMGSGSTFQDTVRAMFNPSLDRHTIKFRTVDQVGNTSLLPSIVYPDVSFQTLEGVVEKTYTGDSIFQTGVTCSLDEDKYELKTYRNNVNVGTASFNIEGVFPYTIGRKTYNFTINPAPLAGEITLEESDFVYDGQAKTPEWSFSEESYATLVYDVDYTVEWSDNTLPGTATLTICGKGNYTGSLTKTFQIDKAPLTANLYEITLPDEDISYDETAHSATVNVAEGVGTVTITYKKGEDVFLEAPTEEGTYDIYLQIADGTLYYGLSNQMIGSFTIYKFNEEEWVSLQALYDLLAPSNPEWAQKWEPYIHAEHGILNVGSLPGVEVGEGHLVGINLTNENLTGTFPAVLLTFKELLVIDLTGNNLSGDISATATFMNEYLQSAPDFTSRLQTLNLTGNHLSGNIGLLAKTTGASSILSHFPELNTLWAAGNQFDEVQPYLPATIVNLDLSNQITDRGLAIDLAALNAESFISTVPGLLLYNHQEQSYNTTPYLRLANYPPTVASGTYSSEKPYWGIDVSFPSGSPSVACISGNNTYKGASGDTLYISYPLSSAEVTGSYCYTLYEFLMGDVNFTGDVNVLDLQATINYIFNDYQVNPFNFTAADTYVDSHLNVQDVVRTANIILDTEEPVGARKSQIQTRNEAKVPDAYLYARDGKLMVSTSVPIASLDISFDGNPHIDFRLDALGYDVVTKQQNGKTRTIAYTLSDQFIPVGETALATFSSSSPIVASVTLASPDAQPVRAAFVDNITSINAISDAAPNDKTEYYSVGGVRLTKPGKGTTIIRSISADNKVSTKVIYIK